MSSRSRYIVAGVKRKTLAAHRSTPSTELYAAGSKRSVRQKVADKLRSLRKSR